MLFAGRQYMRTPETSPNALPWAVNPVTMLECAQEDLHIPATHTVMCCLLQLSTVERHTV